MTKYTTIFGLITLLIGFIILNPTHLLMPESVNSMAVLALIIAFLIFTSLVWKENPRDERENAHIQVAGRVSFIVGSAILIIGIVTQAFNHAVDPWLLFALSGMVLAKFLARIYAGRRN